MSYLLVGRIGRAVGLKGEVEIAVASDEPKRFEPGSVVLLADGLSPLTIRSRRVRGERTIVAFAEAADRNAAELLLGRDLVISSSDARVLGDGEYWDHDLIDCLVVTSSGDEIGRVTDVLHQPANDVLAVESDAGEKLIPLVKDVVRSVDPRVRIVIEPLPGMLD